MSTLSSAGQGVVNTVRGSVPSKMLSDVLSDPIAAQTCGMTRFQRTMAFSVLLMCALGSLALAFATLPLIVLRPAKFAVSYTIGSALLLCSFALINGPINYAKSLVASDRIMFTAIYLGSLGLTLYSSLISQSYSLALLSSIVQMVAMLWYVASYFPGGVAALSFIASLCTRSARSILPI